MSEYSTKENINFYWENWRYVIKIDIVRKLLND